MAKGGTSKPGAARVSSGGSGAGSSQATSSIPPPPTSSAQQATITSASVPSPETKTPGTPLRADAKDFKPALTQEGIGQPSAAFSAEGEPSSSKNKGKGKEVANPAASVGVESHTAQPVILETRSPHPGAPIIVPGPLYTSTSIPWHFPIFQTAGKATDICYKSIDDSFAKYYPKIAGDPGSISAAMEKMEFNPDVHDEHTRFGLACCVLRVIMPLKGLWEGIPEAVARAMRYPVDQSRFKPITLRYENQDGEETGWTIGMGEGDLPFWGHLVLALDQLTQQLQDLLDNDQDDDWEPFKTDKGFAMLRAVECSDSRRELSIAVRTLQFRVERAYNKIKAYMNILKVDKGAPMEEFDNVASLPSTTYSIHHEMGKNVPRIEVLMHATRPIVRDRVNEVVPGFIASTGIPSHTLVEWRIAPRTNQDCNTRFYRVNSELRTNPRLLLPRRSHLTRKCRISLPRRSPPRRIRPLSAL